jgi:hypothetical protein
VTTVLVTKTVPPSRIWEAWDLGWRDFGESRVQEFKEKKRNLPAEIRWHFVGRLQTNKVKSIVGEIELLHSLDRVALAEEIEKQAEKMGGSARAVPLLIQVNTTGEATKSGFAPDELEKAVETLAKFGSLRIRGLMTIGPLTEDQEAVRSSFRKLRLLRDGLREKFSGLPITHLSMGMSSDFELAVEEGATLLRIGTAVFGERPQ